MTATTMAALLEIADLDLSFGGVKVLDGVSFDVNEGECVGLIGPNGAGKSSLLNCISRSYRQQRGRITFAGLQLDSLRPHQVVAAGISRTFQNVELSPARSVLRNTLVGAHSRMRAGFLEGLLATGRCRNDERRADIEARKLLDQFGLGAVAERPLAELPYGSRKLVEIARALLGKPRLLLLDEPVAGTNPDERSVISSHIKSIAGELGLSIVLVEHNVEFVRALAQRIVVIDFGVVIAAGPPEQVLSDPAVVAAYIGEQHR